MKLDRLPRDVLIKLMQLDQRAEEAAKLADEAEQRLSEARDLLNGRREDPRVNITALRAQFDTILADATDARRNATALHSALSRIKLWVAQLADGSALEIVKPARLNGATLSSTRARRTEIESEIAAIEAAPEPPSRESLDAYVARLARRGQPEFRNGKVYWPQHESATNRNQLTDFASDAANALLLEAWLRPEQFAARLYDTRVQECRKACPCPLEDRAARLAALQSELAELMRVQAALDDDIDPACPPAITLGVQVVANGGAA
jgi:hypothetical protein